MFAWDEGAELEVGAVAESPNPKDSLQQSPKSLVSGSAPPSLCVGSVWKEVKMALLMRGV